MTTQTNNHETATCQACAHGVCAIGTGSIPDFGPEADAAVKAACARFPATFGLKAFSENTFRVSLRASYMSQGRVMIYTERNVSREGFVKLYGREPRYADELWIDFAKGTVSELLAQIIKT